MARICRLHTLAKPLGTKAWSQWGTIDKFEAATWYRQVSIPSLYLTVEASRSDQPRCRDQDATSAKTSARTASAVTAARAAIPDAKINAAARRADSARASLAPVN
ncbi:uncharacterized protein LOC105183510 [Harpegnathos saltator]|uniref:uncharacterized protein LOC105183510 n=1 Tax=Harpegnathos saltator TaxID=610380 RepID=UPI00058EA135|nr:uncharacterized protein LOC105183510 [Harpegnathos saltator]